MNARSVVWGTLLICFLGFAGWKVLRHFQHKSAENLSDSDLKSSLETSTPGIESGITLRTALQEIAKNDNPNAEITDSSSHKRVSPSKSDHMFFSHNQFSPEAQQAATKYFETILTNFPEVKQLYKNSSKIYGESEEGNGAAKWVTLGAIFDSSATYGDALHIAMKKVNQNPEAVLETINSNIQTIQKDPFIYQMTMNLIHELDVDISAKTQFYGAEIEKQLKNATSSTPSDSFWVAVLGLTIAKDAGVTSKEIEPYLRRGLAESKAGPQLIEDFKRTAKMHFRGVNL